MTDAAPRPCIESLLEHAGWVSGLARSLARNPADADDLEQETWRAAVRNPPATVEHPRAWLHTVMLSIFHARHRADTRRGERELLAARPAVAEDSADVLERAEMSQRLVGYVLDLPEPFQRTLLLHYFDGLTPREIAERFGEPLETVRSRIKRGLAKLRERMEKEHGDNWIAALAPLVFWPQPAGAASHAAGSSARRRWTWRIAAGLAAASLAVSAIVVYRSDKARAERSGANAASEASDRVRNQPRSAERQAAPEAADADNPGDATGPDAASATTAPAKVMSDLATTKVVLHLSTDDGSTPGRVTVTATPLAAPKRAPRGTSLELVADSGVLSADLPLFDEQNRRVAEWQFQVNHPDYLELERRLLVSLPGEPSPGDLVLTLQLRRAARIVARVQFEPAQEGDRAVLASIDAATTSRTVFEHVEASPGELVSVRLPPGRPMAYLAAAPDRSPWGAEVRLGRGEVKDLGVVVLERGARVSGRISSEHGRIVPGQRAAIRLRDIPSTGLVIPNYSLTWLAEGPIRYASYPIVSADGSFSAEGLPSGPVRVSFEDVFHRTTTDISRSPDLVFDAPTDAANAVFTGAIVRVTVSKGGSSVPGVLVSVEPLPSKGTGGGTTLPDGTIDVLVKPRTRHSVSVRESSGLTSPVVEVESGDRGTITGVELEATDLAAKPPRPTATWTVAFRGAAENCVAASIGLFDPSKADAGTPRHTCDGVRSGGGWRFDGLPPGRWLVRLRPGSNWLEATGWFQTIHLERVFAAGDNKPQSFDASSGGRLAVAAIDATGAPASPVGCRVLDSNGVPVPLLFVTRSPNSWGSNALRLSVNGPTEALDALAPGRYRLEFLVPPKGPSLGTQEAEILPERRTEVVFQSE